MGAPTGSAADVEAGAEERPSWRATSMPGIAWYLVVRAVLLAETLVIAYRRHLAVTRILEPRDGHFYVQIATVGYPVHYDPHKYSSLGFFPLYPLVGRGLSIVTRLPVIWCLMLVTWSAGLALVVLGARLATDRWGLRRGRQAAVMLAVFPGAVAFNMTYADAFALALAAGSLLALDRRRHLLAGVLGATAAAALSVAALPLAAAAVVVAVVRRRPAALLTAVLVPLGMVGFFAYLWAHTGSPLAWWRVEHGAWGAHLSFPWTHGNDFARYGFLHPQVATLTASSLLVAAICLVVLAALRAPLHWIAYAGAVYAAVVLGGGAHLTPRHLMDAFPGVMALGAALHRWLVVPVALVCVAGLVFLFAAYSPNNPLFLAP